MRPLTVPSYLISFQLFLYDIFSFHLILTHLISSHFLSSHARRFKRRNAGGQYVRTETRSVRSGTLRYSLPDTAPLYWPNIEFFILLFSCGVHSFTYQMLCVMNFTCMTRYDATWRTSLTQRDQITVSLYYTIRYCTTLCRCAARCLCWTWRDTTSC